MFYFQATSSANLGGIVENMYKHPLTVTRNSTLAYANSLKVGVMVRNIQSPIFHNDKKNEYAMELQQAVTSIRQHQQVINERILGEEGKKLAKKTNTVLNEWVNAVSKINPSGVSKPEHLSEFIRLEAQLSGLYVEIVEYAKVKGDGFYSTSVNSIKKSNRLGLIFFIVAIIFITTLATLVFKSIARSLNALKDTIEIIKRDSDLSGRVKVQSKCEIGSIANDFNDMMVKIENTVVKGLEAANSISSSNKAFDKQTNAILDSASEQSIEIGRITHIISEINQGIQAIAQHADNTNNKVAEANTAATRSDTLVKQMVVDIQALADSASKTTTTAEQLKQDTDNIDSILEVIKSIAEQTNLLALNAAIEAARAGEQGRGFAVVADEVRNLAERTTQSTSEIHQTITKLQAGTDSVVNAIAGNGKLVNNSIEKAQDVTADISRIHLLMDEISNMNNGIAKGTHDQANASANADRLIQTISVISDKNKENATSINQHNQALLDLSEALNHSMRQFKVSS